MADPSKALDELELLAKAAKLPQSVEGCHISVRLEPANLDAAGRLLELFKAANPGTVLRLVAVAKAAAELQATVRGKMGMLDLMNAHDALNAALSKLAAEHEGLRPEERSK